MYLKQLREIGDNCTYSQSGTHKSLPIRTYSCTSPIRKRQEYSSRGQRQTSSVPLELASGLLNPSRCPSRGSSTVGCSGSSEHQLEDRSRTLIATRKNEPTVNLRQQLTMEAQAQQLTHARRERAVREVIFVHVGQDLQQQCRRGNTRATNRPM